MISDINLIITLFLFLGVAILYSTAGFGGGSSYLAILALLGFGQYMTRSIALCCNISVVALAVVQFNKNELLPSRKAGIISLFSIPFSFWASQFELEERYFFILLALILLLSAIVMLVSPKFKRDEVNGFRDSSFLIPVIVGIVIGFLAGLVSIGGGIFLAPLLYWLNYEKPKKIAAIASFFILINSISALLGLAQSGKLAIDGKILGMLLVAVLLGGYIGNKITVHYLKPLLVKKITALLIVLVAIRLLWKYIPTFFV